VAAPTEGAGLSGGVPCRLAEGPPTIDGLSRYIRYSCLIVKTKLTYIVLPKATTSTVR